MTLTETAYFKVENIKPTILSAYIHTDSKVHLFSSDSTGVYGPNAFHIKHTLTTGAMESFYSERLNAPTTMLCLSILAEGQDEATYLFFDTATNELFLYYWTYFEF